MRVTEDLPHPGSGYLIRGEGREIVAILVGGWPTVPELEMAGVSHGTPTSLVGDTAIWDLTVQQVAAYTHAFRVPFVISVNGRSAVAGTLRVADKGTPGTGTQVGALRIVVGPPGPPGPPGPQLIPAPGLPGLYLIGN